MELIRYGKLIWRRRWHLLTLMVLATGLILVNLPRKQADYKATATVMPSAGVIHAEGRVEAMQRDRQMANLLILARSREVARRALEQSRLDMTLEEVLGAVEIKPQQVRPFSLSGLSDTDLIEISAVHANRGTATLIANAMAVSFSDYYRDLTHAEAGQIRNELNRRVESSRRQLHAAEAKLNAFRRASGTSLPDARSALLQEYANTMALRDQAAVNAREASARLEVVRRQFKGQPVNRISEQGTTNNPTVQALESRLADLSLKLATESALRTADHPAVIALKREAAGVRTELDSVVKRIFTHETITSNPLWDRLSGDLISAESESIASRARLSGASTALSRMEGRLNGVSASETRYASLMREVDMAGSTYASFTDQMNEAVAAEMSLAGSSGGIRIIDLASDAELRSADTANMPFVIAFGLLASLFAGILLVLGLDYLDDSVHTGDDKRLEAQKPLLGEIPRIGVSRGNGGIPFIQQDHALDISPFGEACRLLRTSFIFRIRRSHGSAVVICSAHPHEGRSTIAVNLAAALALSGRRVLLVDADLREPVLHRIFSMPNDMGLSTVLMGKDTLSDGMRETAVDNLRLLPSGPMAANPSELLGGTGMENLVRAMKEENEIVLFDTPAAIAFTDACLLAAHVDSVLQVIGAGKTSLSDHRLTLEQMDMVGVPLLGTVINGVEPADVRSYKAYKEHLSRPLDMAQLKKRAVIGAGAIILAAIVTFAGMNLDLPAASSVVRGSLVAVLNTADTAAGRIQCGISATGRSAAAGGRCVAGGIAAGCSATGRGARSAASAVAAGAAYGWDSALTAAGIWGAGMSDGTSRALRNTERELDREITALGKSATKAMDKVEASAFSLYDGLGTVADASWKVTVRCHESIGAAAAGSREAVSTGFRKTTAAADQTVSASREIGSDLVRSVADLTTDTGRRARSLMNRSTGAVSRAVKSLPFMKGRHEGIQPASAGQ